MPKVLLRLWLCVWASFFLPGHSALAQVQILHLINNAGSNAAVTLNAGFAFTTSFKGINDVTINQSTGSVHSLYPESFGGVHAANNPAYVTNFAGSASLGNGDGVAGDLTTLETALGTGTNQWRFDFSQPLTSSDHMLVTDVEDNEMYGIRAFVATNGGYQAVSMTNWLRQNFAGETGTPPDSTWALWDSTNGLLVANTASSLNEPLIVLTPDRPIDRIVFVKYAVGGGSASVQFLAQPTSAVLPQLQIKKAGTNAVVFWPDAFTNFKLYQADALSNGAAWTLDPNTAGFSGGLILVTNRVAGNKFYRLQNP